MQTNRIATGLIVALCCHTPLLAIDVDDPPAGTFCDEWYVILIRGQKSGHAHSTLERLSRAGGDVIRTATDTVLEMGRAGQTVKVTVSQSTEESLDGRPLAFAHKMTLGAMPGPTTTATIKDGKVTVTASQFSQTAEPKTYDLPAGAMMTWAVYREQIKRGLKPGTRYELPLYEPTLAPDRLTPATVEILDREMIDLFGRKVEAVKAKQTLRLPGMSSQPTVIETSTWITPEGDPLRIRMSMMNIPIEMIACAKSVATAPNDPAEFMADTFVHVDKPVNPAARKIVYRLALKDAKPPAKLPAPPETDIQAVQRVAPDTVKLTISRRADRPGPGSVKLTPEERKRYLAATSVVNYKDPVVADLARQAAGDEKDPWKLAERLCRFVDRYVEGKNLSVGFATASEVARSKEGDCTEHGILLAALGRAVGIPTRVATGILYARGFAGQQHVFVGHLWTQFFIDGRWVDLDASHDQTVVDPTHIALGISDAGDSGIADLVSSVWLTLGNMKMTVLASE